MELLTNQSTWKCQTIGAWATKKRKLFGNIVPNRKRRCETTNHNEWRGAWIGMIEDVRIIEDYVRVTRINGIHSIYLGVVGMGFMGMMKEWK